MKELLTRVIVAFLGIPILVFLIWQGDWYFFTLILVIAVGGQLEFYNFAKQKEIYAQYIPGVLITVIILFAIQNGINNYLLICLLIVSIFSFAFEMSS